MKTEKYISSKLLEIKAIKLNIEQPFLWSSGIKSPIYCDNRLTLSYPKIRSEIKFYLSETIQKKFAEANCIVGVATAGIPHGVLVADQLNLPFGYVRSNPKNHGRKNVIEGQIKEKDKVVVIEDLISTGNSAIKVIEILREQNIEVIGVASIFSYNLDKARENFNSKNVKYSSLSNYDVLIDEALNSQSISQEQYDSLQQWKFNPENWLNS